MGVEIKGPEVQPAPTVERKARGIEDPVHRLRYLRRAMWLGSAAAAPMPPGRRWRRWLQCSPLLMIVLLLVPIETTSTRAWVIPARPAAKAPAAGDPARRLSSGFPNVWLVEKTKDYEVFSNGLRVEDGFAVSNRPREKYPIFSAAGRDVRPVAWGDAPVGIVYHTTESLLKPFEADENSELKRIARNLVDIVGRSRSYHFVIDRFGRVFRVVEESDAANHAGYSTWANESNVYVNLNDSFLGIAFEAKTEPGAVNPTINPAQIHAARVLTEMLRGRYRIPASNCVTHAQVSVNPLNMRIGYHVDWSGNFPFAEVGLGDNYRIPLPSLYTFGFDYDSVFLRATGSRPWKGLLAAEQMVLERASNEGLTASAYRALLRQRYKQIAAFLKDKNRRGEDSDENN